ncbi:MAG: tetratricopeptide repeat protein [Bacteriovoracaceae bacterium]|nr:tetratricopeptide repeat protein [Bacteriovoracaceae bacterium]
MDNKSKQKVVGQSKSSNSESMDINGIIMEYKVQFISVVVLIFVAIVGYGIYSKYDSAQSEKLSAKIYSFTKGAYADYNAEKLQTPELMEKIFSLSEEVGSFVGLIPLIVEVSDKLIKQGKLDSARKLLEMGRERFLNENAYVKRFLLMRLAVVYEDLDRPSDAISVLEQINASSVKILEERVYFDLGRLYLKQGNKDKASVSLQHVVDNFASNDLAKIAALYLKKIGK